MCYFCNSYLANRYVMSNIVFAAVACISATEVHGYGEAPNIFNFDSISAYARVEILIESTKVEEAAQSIIDAAHTSKEGDGMAAILPVK